MEGEGIRKFFKDHIFGQEVTTFDHKWLRVMPYEKFTGCHVDSVYMSRGTQRLLTCWIPFGDIPVRKLTYDLKLLGVSLVKLLCVAFDLLPTAQHSQ